MARHDLGAGEQPREIGGATRLAGVRAHCHQVGSEGAVGAKQRLCRHGCRHVRHLEQPAHVVEGQQQHPENAVCAVDQSEAPLAVSVIGSIDTAASPGGGGDALARGRPDLALAD